MNEWLQPALRFFHYLLLLGLFGWTAFRVVGLRAASWVPVRIGRNAAIIAADLNRSCRPACGLARSTASRI
jgi:copper resistance protein D